MSNWERKFEQQMEELGTRISKQFDDAMQRMTDAFDEASRSLPPKAEAPPPTEVTYRINLGTERHATVKLPSDLTAAEAATIGLTVRAIQEKGVGK